MNSVHLIRRMDDAAQVLRASIGGTAALGYYCVQRGSKAQIVAMLETVLKALKATPELPIDERTAEPWEK